MQNKTSAERKKIIKSRNTDHHPSINTKTVVPATNFNRCPAYGKICGGCGKLNHFCVVYKTSDDKNATVHKVEQDKVTGKQIDMVNITSFTFHSIQPVIIAN